MTILSNLLFIAAPAALEFSKMAYFSNLKQTGNL